MARRHQLNGHNFPVRVNYLRTSDSGKASFFLLHDQLPGKEDERWIPNSIIENLEDIDWGGGECYINLPGWFVEKAGIDV